RPGRAGRAARPPRRSVRRRAVARQRQRRRAVRDRHAADHRRQPRRLADDVQNTPNPEGAQLSENDALELFVDGGHEQANSFDNNDWQLVYSADEQKTAARGTNVGIVTWPMTAKQAWSRTSPAWTLEAAIPWSILGGGTISPGKLVGFDLKLDDNDSGTMRERDLILYYGTANG